MHFCCENSLLKHFLSRQCINTCSLITFKDLHQSSIRPAQFMVAGDVQTCTFSNFLAILRRGYCTQAVSGDICDEGFCLCRLSFQIFVGRLFDRFEIVILLSVLSTQKLWIPGRYDGSFEDNRKMFCILNIYPKSKKK